MISTGYWWMWMYLWLLLFFFFSSPLLFIVDWEGCKSFRGLIYFLPIHVSKLRNSEQCHEQFYGLMVRFGKSFFWFRELGVLTSYLSSESAGSLKKKFFLHSPLELLLFWKRKKKNVWDFWTKISFMLEFRSPSSVASSSWPFPASSIPRPPLKV